MPLELQQERIHDLEMANQEYPNHRLLSFVATVRLERGETLSAPKVQTMICADKQPTQLSHYVDYHKESLDIGVFLRICPIHSQIMVYISRNFEKLISDPKISLLSKD